MSLKAYMDVDTGEMVEFLPEQMNDLTPYSFREAKAAAMRCSSQRRQAVTVYEEAIKKLAAAENEYRKQLALEVLNQKRIGPSTTAEVLAKGEPQVRAARERYTLADGMRYAALEAIRGCDGDRQGVAQLSAWSRGVALGPWGEGQG
jgi:hypothetical protein